MRWAASRSLSSRRRDSNGRIDPRWGRAAGPERLRRCVRAPARAVRLPPPPLAPSGSRGRAALDPSCSRGGRDASEKGGFIGEIARGSSLDAARLKQDLCFYRHLVNSVPRLRLPVDVPRAFRFRQRHLLAVFRWARRASEASVTQTGRGRGGIGGKDGSNDPDTTGVSSG
jgi:hypothetical protein